MPTSIAKRLPNPRLIHRPFASIFLFMGSLASCRGEHAFAPRSEVVKAIH